MKTVESAITRKQYNQHKHANRRISINTQTVESALTWKQKNLR